MHKTKKRTLPGIAILLLLLLGLGGKEATAQGSPLHPNFPLLDEAGNNVLDSGRPLSTMTTCGACHDTAFIEGHSFHADVGLEDLADPGQTQSGRAWDISPGLFGKWNPLTNRFLSPTGDQRIDLTTPEWVQLFGARHVGGGPAVTSREGGLLTELTVVDGDPETHIVDPETGALVPWDWSTSGVVEMNCFLCHTPDPNNEARIETLGEGSFQWANTATLLGSGIVDKVGHDWNWNRAAFDDQGQLLEEYNLVQDPTDTNCSQCHGLVHVEAQTPLVTNRCEPSQWSTLTTGQIYSPQILANSGINLADKGSLDRTWDVHAERVVGCTDCHYALNNPVYYRESEESRPDHLIFDPRRIDLGEYLYRPLHQFAKGQSAQGTVAPELDNTLRRCESCHSIEATHDWLPYKEQHTSALACETCHIPKLYAPARQYEDLTVVRDDGAVQAGCRGIVEQGETFSQALITGYEPVLLPRQNGDGTTSLAPHNLITSWFWVYGNPERPVPARDLQAAWMDGDEYHPAILNLFDKDENGRLDDEELVIDSVAKEELIAGRLELLGLDKPRIVGEIQPYSINHDVTHGEWATSDCRTCHGEDSRVTRPIMLADRMPGGVMPAFVKDSSTNNSGNVEVDGSGNLYYKPVTKPEELYILGHDDVDPIDLGGLVIFLGTLAGVSVHGGSRYFFARRHAPADPALREEYMYGVYERLWHWLQTLVIVGLLFTGLIIHKPDTFGIFGFKYVVEIHNILSFILVANAALAAFYHLASGEIRQFLPRPRGFFDQAFEQAVFYLRGIFRGEAHPFEKTRKRKLNPLQQITYFAILNVLLPLQVITGLLMWGRQSWPEAAAQVGGLPFLAPFHTIIAWLFASFIVMHVYLTTTGHTATASIRAMIMGWDEVEVHSPRKEAPLQT